MISKHKKIQKLLEIYKEISLLGKISSVLSYDMNVSLPEAASEDRATQSAYIVKLLSEKWSNIEIRNLIEDLKNDSGLSNIERAIIRNLDWQGKYYWKVPQSTIVEFSEATSRAFMAWQKAKKDNSFADFLPHLAKVIRLNQLIADHLGYMDNPYDALLDIYEPGLTTNECKSIFGILQPELTKLLKNIQKSRNYKDSSELVGINTNYPVDDQRQVSLFVARKLGYDFNAGRLDTSSHPFTETLGRHDVRITTRYKTTDFRESLTGTIHEVGHALYEQGVSEEYEYTPLDGGISLGIHESQSRFWENQVGRSQEFISFITPVLHTLYNDHLGKSDSDELYRLFNLVNPGFIRTESDEVTYNLHIALRFEIEEGLINGKLDAKDLPEIWNTKMKKYLGVVPETDREGVLQDVHWSFGNFGYFPTYTLGNLYSAQFTKAMKREINIEELSKNGEFGPVLSWLRTNIHQHGSVYWPGELVKKVTSKKLDPQYLLDYLNKKYSILYRISE